MDLSKISMLQSNCVPVFRGKRLTDLFYHNLSNSSTWDQALGYFRLSSYSLFAYPLAKFILKNNGVIRVFCNIELSIEDYNILSEAKRRDIVVDDLFTDLKSITFALENKNEKLFSDCIAFLIQQDRFEIKVLIRRDNARGIAHEKTGIFKDNKGNIVTISGSANASEQAYQFNREKMTAACSFWDEKAANNTIEDFVKDFDDVFTNGDEEWQILSIDSKELKAKLAEVGYREIDENDLYNDSRTFFERNKEIFTEEIQKEIELELSDNDLKQKSEPRFPFPDGPRSDQTLAYERWVDNEYKGLFAMATGTGKTVTALNCVLEEWKEKNYYRVIVLVPTKALAMQWRKEALNKFNFISASFTGEDRDWRNELDNAVGCYKNGIDVNFLLITTYALFKRNTFQSYLQKLIPLGDTITLIADEAHALGSSGSLSKLPYFINKRIGLSATPGRQYDDLGNQILSDFFRVNSPVYTINYTMKRAIDDGVLCEYKYYPRFCHLNKLELKEYSKYTKRLSRYINPSTGKYLDCPEANRLLILRKNIIHKAAEKIEVFNDVVVNDIKLENLKFTFVYVPEGFEPDYWNIDTPDKTNDDEDVRLINLFSQSLGKRGLRVAKFLGETQDKEDILEMFSQGKYDALIAMKCLDEGIDVPRTEYAIFCSSTGNPRQFIQRRGRVLRYHKSKEFAKIYDIIIKPDFDSLDELTPTEIQNEKNIFKTELFRIINFAAIANNRMEIAEGQLGEICKEAGINNLLELMNIEMNNQKIDL